MILSNVGILNAIKDKLISIGDLTGDENPSEAPFNTSAIDLRLSEEIVIPEPASIAIDLNRPKDIASLLAAHSRKIAISNEQPFRLEPQRFILAKTRESVAFPIKEKSPCYSARVEGKSSLARWGIIIHFTAPTIHSNITISCVSMKR